MISWFYDSSAGPWALQLSHWLHILFFIQVLTVQVLVKPPNGLHINMYTKSLLNDPSLLRNEEKWTRGYISLANSLIQVGYSSHLLELFILKRIVTCWKDSSRWQFRENSLQYLLKTLYIVAAMIFCKCCAEAMAFFYKIIKSNQYFSTQ